MEKIKILATVVGLLASAISVYQALPAIVTLLETPKAPLTRPHLDIQVSSNKYQYRIGENITLYYHVTTDSTVETIIEKPDKTKSTVAAFEAKSGTHADTIGVAWYPTGFRRVVAQASSSNGTAEAFSFYEVVDHPSEELLSSNRTARGATSVYGPSFLILDLKIDGSEGMELTRFPEELIQGRITYQVWSPTNVSADQTWHLLFVYSWAQSWPPTTELQEIYNGIPGRWPVPERLKGFRFQAPSTPGTYYVWVVAASTSTTGEAVAQLKGPLSLPAYLKIKVVPKLKTWLTITVSSAEIPWGSSVSINGRIGLTNPNLTEITVAYSSSHNEGDFRILTVEKPGTQGEFEYKWTPVLLQTYAVKAVWNGSVEYEPASSGLVYINVIIPWTHFGFGAVAVIAFSAVIVLWKRPRIGGVRPRSQKHHHKTSNKSRVRSLVSRVF